MRILPNPSSHPQSLLVVYRLELLVALERVIDSKRVENHQSYHYHNYGSICLEGPLLDWEADQFEEGVAAHAHEEGVDDHAAVINMLCP